MNVLGVIPARLQSMRLAEKVLRDIAGKPMIVRVLERVRQSRLLTDAVVACDDEKIASCVREFGGRVVMTRTDHPNGTSRIAEVAEKEKADLYVNIQGDEPLIEAESIDILIKGCAEDANLSAATLCVSCEDEAGWHDPNVVKVVTDADRNALYFSRAPIPLYRDGGFQGYEKHLGIYAYRKDLLMQFVTWEKTRLEELEKLEQLRMLENGVKLRVFKTPYDSIGVDTEDDLQKVEALIKTKSKESEVC